MQHIIKAIILCKIADRPDDCYIFIDRLIDSLIDKCTLTDLLIDRLIVLLVHWSIDICILINRSVDCFTCILIDLYMQIDWLIDILIDTCILIDRSIDCFTCILVDRYT